MKGIDYLDFYLLKVLLFAIYSVLSYTFVIFF